MATDRKAFEDALRVRPLEPQHVAALVRKYDLNDRAARNLEVCLRHIEADLEDFIADSYSRKERAELILKRKTAATLLSRLAQFLKNNEAHLAEVLPNQSLEAIGELLDKQEIVQALGADMPRYMRVYDGPHERKAVGLQHGGRLLSHAIDRVQAPIDGWLAQNKQNKGGHPMDRRRRVFVERLAADVPDILGERATSTASGRFVTFCSDVLGAYGLATEGLADVIEDVVRPAGGRSRSA